MDTLKELNNIGSADNPLVSIGIPTYNRPITLERTLNCLINQTYFNLEIIVSDNCSSDPAVEQTLNKFSTDSRFKYFKQTANKGAIFNSNFVLEKATGEFIMRLADDDWIDPDYIESCLKQLIDNPEYSSAYGPSKIYNNQGELLWEDTAINMEQENGEERVKQYLRNTVYNAPFYGLMRRNYLSFLTTTSKLADDWLVVSRIAFSGKYKMMENTRCHISQGGISQSFDSLVHNLKMPKYVKYFPYFEVCKNVFADILWGSQVYKSLSFFQRLKFGAECYGIIWKRFRVTSELKHGFIILLKKGYKLFIFKHKSQENKI